MGYLLTLQISEKTVLDWEDLHGEVHGLIESGGI